MVLRALKSSDTLPCSWATQVIDDSTRRHERLPREAITGSSQPVYWNSVHCLADDIADDILDSLHDFSLMTSTIRRSSRMARKRVKPHKKSLDFMHSMSDIEDFDTLLLSVFASTRCQNRTGLAYRSAASFGRVVSVSAARHSFNRVVAHRNISYVCRQQAKRELNLVVLCLSFYAAYGDYRHSSCRGLVLNAKLLCSEYAAPVIQITNQSVETHGGHHYHRDW